MMRIDNHGIKDRMMRTLEALFLHAMVITALVSIAHVSDGQDSPDFLRDRGNGISTSLFGTYIEKGNVIIYPFFEHYEKTYPVTTQWTSGMIPTVNIRVSSRRTKN